MSIIDEIVGPKKIRVTEASLNRRTIINYVRQLFKRTDFPAEIFVALDSGCMAMKGDVVWPSTDCEHPFDFIPLAGIDQLVVNLPSKTDFLRKIGVDKIEDVPPEAEARFWEEFDFEFGSIADSVKLVWK